MIGIVMADSTMLMIDPPAERHELSTTRSWPSAVIVFTSAAFEVSTSMNASSRPM